MVNVSEENGMHVTNNITCPVCGSDMRREVEDSPHDVYTAHYVCCNHETCGISSTVLS